MVLQHLPRDLAVLQWAPACALQLGQLLVTLLMPRPCPELRSALLCWVMVLLRQSACEQKEATSAGSALTSFQPHWLPLL